MSRILQPTRGRSWSGAELAVLVLVGPLLWVGRSAFGRRLLAVAVLALVAAGLVVALYQHPDVGGEDGAGGGAPPAGTRPAVAGTGQPATPPPRAPELAAAAWYARRLGVRQARVRALQRQRVNDAEVRVLVIAELDNGRLPTAVVTVRRGPAGWQVTP
jgi:hypothetical protein